MSSFVQQCFFHLITEQMTEANIELEYIKVTENLNVLQFAEMFHKCFWKLQGITYFFSPLLQFLALFIGMLMNNELVKSSFF